MEQENKDKLKKAGKMVGKTALGLGKAWFHVSKAMAEDAIGVSIGSPRRERERAANLEINEAANAFSEMKNQNQSISSKDIPDIK